MKKVAIILVLILSGIGAYWLWLKLSPNKFVDGFYLVPDDAAMVIETRNPVNNWTKFSSSDMWAGLKSFPAFSEIGANADMLDKLIQSNQQVFALLGQRHLLISFHMTKAKDYDFVFYADLESVSKSDIIKASLTNVIRQFGYSKTVRNYNGQEIIEFHDPKTKEILSLSYLNNYIALSYNKLLLNKVVDASAKPDKQLGMRTDFTEVDRLTSNQGLCRLFVNYKTFPDYLGVYMSDVSTVREWLSSLSISAVDFSLDDNLVKGDGYTIVNDTVSSYLQALSVSGSAGTGSEKIISERASFFVSLGYDKFTEFYANLISILQEDKAAYKEQQVAIKKTERLLGIQMDKHLFSWMGSEAAIAQYATDKKYNHKLSQVMALKVNSIESAKENLSHIEKQIRKRTPVKFKTVEYKGYEIKYLEMKGVFKHLFGKLFSKIDKPYYTFIKDYVLFSDDPRTLLLTIDDYEAQKTLSNKESYRDFRSNLNDKVSVLAYLNPDEHFDNFRHLLNRESWTSSKKYQHHIRSFQQVGISLTGSGDKMRTVLCASYKKWEAPVEVNLPDSADDDSLSVMDLFLIENFQNSMMKEYYSTGVAKSVAEMDGKIRNGVYTEYYSDGKVSVRGRYLDGVKNGVWRYYKENGKLDKKERYKNGELVKESILDRVLDRLNIPRKNEEEVPE